MSNPTIATTVFPFFFWCLYEAFFSRKNKFLPWLALCLGLINQSMIFSVLWWVVIFIAYWLRALQEKSIIFLPKRTMFTVAIIYLLSVSTILLTQLKLFVAGIFSLEAISQFPSSSLSPSDTFQAITKLYVDKLLHSVWPAMPLLGGVIFILIAFHVLRNLENKSRNFLLLLVSGPFWLSILVFRNSYHALIGLEIFIPLILGLAFSKLNSLNRVIGITFISLTILLNLIVPFTDPRRYPEPFMVQSGVYLHDERELINTIYEHANGRSFSISTMTNPFGWNTTWAWLFTIYKPSNQSLPVFFGPDQTGIFGHYLLEQVTHPLDLHYTIIEPDILITSSQVGIDFFAEQNAYAGSSSAELITGEFRAEVRDRAK